MTINLPRSGDDHSAQIREASSLLRRAGAISEGFAGIQYDLNSTWRRMPSGNEINAHLCDHNCTITVLGEATGGNYICPASLSLNHGVSRRWLAPADVILRSISTLEKGIEAARNEFFSRRFDGYCQHFGLPSHVAAAMREVLDKPGLEINMFGGNPEMHPQVATIIGELRQSGHRVHFTTTGRRLMREPKFVESLLATPPNIIALSADDFDDAQHIEHLASLSAEQLRAEWKSVPRQHGQRQKACEAMYVAKLAEKTPGFPPMLFNMVIHPGNLRNVFSIVSALTERFPSVTVNPFPAQSAFLNDGGEPALLVEHAQRLVELIDRMIEEQTASVRAGGSPAPYAARLHYWLMLRAAFDAAGEHVEDGIQAIVGEGIWRCYQDPAAGRYLQVGMGVKGQARESESQHPGGYLGCFWNNETVTKKGEQVWDMADRSVTHYIQAEKPELARTATHPCPGCAFPRLTYDMLATEAGMRADLIPFYRKRRAAAFGF